MSKLELDNIDVVLFDLDGTVYYGDDIIPGANETIEFFRKAGKKVFFTTNNSTKTRKHVYDRLVGMGVNCRLEEVLNSGFLATVYCKKNNLNDIYIFGSKDLIDEFAEQGIVASTDESSENLLIGYNVDMDYEFLTSAINVALHAKQIIACNREKIFPGKNARLMPGCGAMTAPIEWCTDRKCDVVIGKPNTFMFDYLVDEYGFRRDRMLVVGDTYESDVVAAKNAGCKAVLIDKQKHDDCVTVSKIIETIDLF